MTIITVFIRDILNQFLKLLMCWKQRSLMVDVDISTKQYQCKKCKMLVRLQTLFLVVLAPKMLNKL